jgi:hypothetical protein
MAKNELDAQYQPCSGVTLLGFDSDYHYHPDLYGDMAITLQPKTVDPQK